MGCRMFLLKMFGLSLSTLIELSLLILAWLGSGPTPSGLEFVESSSKVTELTMDIPATVSAKEVLRVVT